MNKKFGLIFVLMAIMFMSCVSKNDTTDNDKSMMNENEDNTVKEVKSTVTDEADGKFTLKAADAELITKKKMMIEFANKNIGWWNNTEDQAKWKIKVTNDGEYTVKGRYSCSDEFAGATVKISAGDQYFEFVVKGTGDWNNYVTEEFGKIKLQKGEQEVVIQATNIANRFVMNLTDLIFSK